MKRPERLKIDDNGIQAEILVPRNIYDNESEELIDILIAPTLVLSDQKNDGNKHVLPIDPAMFTEDRYKKFNSYTYSIGKIVRLAELNLDSLFSVISLYFRIHPVEEVLNRNSDCRSLREYDIINNFNRLTFGNLRNILSCIIKTDKELQNIEGLESNANRKIFSTVYRDYIEDRDRFTHGILFLLYPSFEPVLRVKTTAGESIYIKYEKQVFIDNLKTYNYLTNILLKIRESLQTQIGNQQNVTAES